MKWLMKKIKRKKPQIITLCIVIVTFFSALHYINWNQLEHKVILKLISNKIDIYVPKGMTAKVDETATYDYKKEMLERTGTDLKNVFYLLLNEIGIDAKPKVKIPIASIKFDNLELIDNKIPEVKEKGTISIIKTNLDDANRSFRQFLSTRIVIVNNDKYIVRDGKLDANSKDILKWIPIIEKNAKKYNIDPALIAAVIEQESGGNPDAISPSGAIGLMQLMPSTAKFLKVNPRDPEENIEGGAKYLAMMLSQFGTQELALAAYNSGPNNVLNNNFVYYPETMGYINNVPRLVDKYRKLIRPIS